MFYNLNSRFVYITLRSEVRDSADVRPNKQRSHIVETYYLAKYVKITGQTVQKVACQQNALRPHLLK